MFTYTLLVVGHQNKAHQRFIKTISDPEGYQDAFGRIRFYNEDQIYLFATPSLDDEFRWEILAEGAHGCFFIVDTSSPEAFDETKRAKEYLRTLVPVATVFVVYQNQATQYSITQIRELLELSQDEGIYQINIDDREAALPIVDLLMNKVREEHP
jgi:signal recognition particle receptor subunit beta